MTTLTRPGGTCVTCGAAIDRRASHCRQHRPVRLTTARARALVERKADLARRDRWLIDVLASQPVHMPLIAPAAVLLVLVEPLDERPAIEHPAYAAYDIALAYAERRHPDADPVQRAGFAVVLHSAATGMSGPFEPPSEPDVERGDDLVLALVGGQPAAPGQIVGVTPPMTGDGQVIAALPPDAMARLVVLALEEAYLGDGYEAALREGMAALLSVRGQSATIARRSIQDLWREERSR